MATTICQLTEKAKTYLQQRKPKDGYVKLGVNGGGCAGFSYEWDTTDEVGDGKLVDDILVVDPMTELYIIGSTICLLYTSPSPRDRQKSRMPSSA